MDNLQTTETLTAYPILPQSPKNISGASSLKKNISSSVSNRSSSKDVVLIFPGKYKSSVPQIPLPLLFLASPLEKAGYRVRIVDARLEDFENVELGTPLFIGISSMSGPQIRYGLEIAKKVREKASSCPIVWGGVHPSLLPEQTASSSFVDIVVRGEGELSVVQLANALYRDDSLENVAGITYKENGEIRSTRSAPLIDLDSIPVDLPYDLLDLYKYPTFKAGRFHIQTSRGCPSRCAFCYNTAFNDRKWRGKSVNRILKEIEFILKKFPHINTIDPVDDNFFVEAKRVEDFCKGMIGKRIDVKWRANCRFDYLATYDQAFFSLLERAGCVELDFGGESGSPEIQSMVCKDVTADQMIKSVEKLGKWAPKIEPFVSWLSGLPNETDEDLTRTFDLMDKMAQVNPKTQHYGVFVYTPFPSPLIESLPAEFKPPQLLEEWGDIEVFHFSPPWHSRKYVERLHSICAVTRYAFYPKARIQERPLLYRWAYQALNKMARFRWRHRYFAFPIELKLADSVAKKIRGFL